MDDDRSAPAGPELEATASVARVEPVPAEQPAQLAPKAARPEPEAAAERPLALVPALAGASQAVAGWAAVTAGAGEVAGAPLWPVGDATLADVLRDQQGVFAQLHAARLAIVRELADRGYPQACGQASMAAWLAHELLIDPTVAAGQVRAARAFDPDADLPPEPGTLAPAAGSKAAGPVLAATGRALLAGEISREHAEAVRTVIRRLPHQVDPAARADLHARAQAWLLPHCHTLDPATIRGLGRELAIYLDPDGQLADERADGAKDELWTRTCPDTGRVSFGGQTDALTGAQLVTFIDAHSAPHPGIGPDGTTIPDPRTPANRRGHAFADLVRLAVGADPTVCGGLDVQLIVTTTLATLQTQLAQHAQQHGQLAGVRCAVTETGVAISPAFARRLACDARIIPILLGANSEPLDIGRATRTIPTAMRRALVVRDRHCAFPGCRRPPRWADAHHIIHWADGGTTCLDNLVLLCGYHHDVLHHTGWTVAIKDHRPLFTPPPPRIDPTRSPRGPTP